MAENAVAIQEHSKTENPFAAITPSYDILKAATPDRVEESGYYGLPILKRPFWKWEIALYFFFEGVSAGAYALCTVASLRDQKRFSTLITRGRYLSFVTMLFCPPLLIVDLGRPERFHHMLRIWKKTSPMNHGAWALSGYGMFASFLALLAWPANKVPFRISKWALRLLQRFAPTRLLAVLGMPFAWTMISYPGVLLETTANPVWSQTNFLGPLFASSSLSSGAAALSLLSYGSDDHGLNHTLHRFEDLASVAEAASLAAYVGTARKATRPLIQGSQKRNFLVGAIGLGLVVPFLLRRSKNKVLRNGVAPVLTLLGSAALKWSVTYAGQESVLDPELASRNASSKTGEPFWGPKERNNIFTGPKLAKPAAE